jgi:DNA repair exonuclease SbcCD ATPase subunit
MVTGNYGYELNKVKTKIDELQLYKKMKTEQLEETKLELSQLNKTLLSAEKARAVVQAVANDVQKSLEYRITNIVTMALASVFPDPYEFKVEFVTRRNQTECDMYFVRDGNECDPMDSTGGGAIDIASLALRMAIWSIKKTRAIQLLDEPAKFLSRDLQEKCSEMLKELSEKLGIQMIIISHIPEMISAADRVFNIELINGESHVRVI